MHSPCRPTLFVNGGESPERWRRSIGINVSKRGRYDRNTGGIANNALQPQKRGGSKYAARCVNARRY